MVTHKRRVGVGVLLAVMAMLIAPETSGMPWPEEGQAREWPPARPALFLTVYDWGMGGVNCDNDCSTTALTWTGDDILGWTAACPSAWLGHVTTTVVTIWGEEWWCVDAFGQPADRVLTEVDGVAVYRIDLAYRPAREHPWNMELVPAGEWSREWRPMREFYQMREWAE